MLTKLTQNKRYYRKIIAKDYTKIFKDSKIIEVVTTEIAPKKQQVSPTSSWG
jgi:hypothetical protein